MDEKAEMTLKNSFLLNYYQRYWHQRPQNVQMWSKRRLQRNASHPPLSAWHNAPDSIANPLAVFPFHDGERAYPAWSEMPPRLQEAWDISDSRANDTTCTAIGTPYQPNHFCSAPAPGRTYVLAVRNSWLAVRDRWGPPAIIALIGNAPHARTYQHWQEGNLSWTSRRAK